MTNEICSNRDFLPFLWPCDLDLDPMTFIYEHDLYFLKIHRMCKYELPASRLSKVIVWHTYIHTERQTRPKLYTTQLRGWSNIYHILVYPMFSMRALSLFLFLLIQLSYGIEVNLALVHQQLTIPVLNLLLCLVVYLLCVLLYQYCPAWQLDCTCTL